MALFKTSLRDKQPWKMHFPSDDKDYKKPRGPKAKSKKKNAET